MNYFFCLYPSSVVVVLFPAGLRSPVLGHLPPPRGGEGPRTGPGGVGNTMGREAKGGFSLEVGLVKPKGKTSVAEGPKVEGGRVRERDGDHGVWEPSSARGSGGGERRGRELVLSCWEKIREKKEQR